MSILDKTHCMHNHRSKTIHAFDSVQDKPVHRIHPMTLVDANVVHRIHLLALVVATEASGYIK